MVSLNFIHNLKMSNLLLSQTFSTYNDEEWYWIQKCKEIWAKTRDHNTKFFHASINANQAKNQLKLIDIQLIEHQSEAVKSMVASTYFYTLFSSSNPSDFSDIFNGFQPRITQSMNMKFTREVNFGEVREAVFSNNPSHAPITDGMSALFYQMY